MKKIIKNKKGISTLMTIIVVSAIALSIALTATLKGIDETNTGLNQTKSLETFTATDGCIEEALVKLNSDHGYTGEILLMGNVSCTITVNGSGNSRTINVTANNSGKYVRDIEVDVDLQNALEITSWTEVTN